jgi:hypothetical protein
MFDIVLTRIKFGMLVRDLRARQKWRVSVHFVTRKVYYLLARPRTKRPYRQYADVRSSEQISKRYASARIDPQLGTCQHRARCVGVVRRLPDTPGAGRRPDSKAYDNDRSRYGRHVFTIGVSSG